MKLGRKQSEDNRTWLETHRNIEDLVPREEVDRLAEKTMDEIHSVTAGRSVSVAWSGGKDSIVLGHLCARVGIDECFFVRCDLEYPAFLRWVTSHKPRKLETINTGQDLEWLANNIHMLFPQDAAITSRWYAIVQHRGQRDYCRRNDLDVLILGRRRADGNFVGRGANCYEDRAGFVRYSPLADWSHEHILAYIHYYNLSLPPIYQWPNGYKCGTHPWPARPYTGSIEEGWSQVYGIDPYIVIEAAKHVRSAQEFLRRHGV